MTATETGQPAAAEEMTLRDAERIWLLRGVLRGPRLKQAGLFFEAEAKRLFAIDRNSAAADKMIDKATVLLIATAHLPD